MATTHIENIYFPVENGKIAFSNTLLNVLPHTFTEQPKFLQGFISQDIPTATNNGAKQFLTISNFPAWLQTDIIQSQCDRHLYEVIPTGQPVRPYFDIEFCPEQLDECSTIDLIYDVIETCFQYIGIDVQHEIVSLFVASGPVSTDKIASGHKISLHMIFNTNAVFRNTAEHKSFIKHIVMPYINSNEDLFNRLYWTDAKGIKRCVIDDAVYGSNQSFRLPLQSKLHSNRPLKPQPTAHVYTIGVYKDPTTLTYISLPTITNALDTSSTETVAADAPAIAPEYALCEALADLLTPDFMADIHNALNVIFCLCAVENSTRMRDLIHKTCAKAKNYEWTWCESAIKQYRYKRITLSSLKSWAETCSTKEDVQKAYKKYYPKYSHELFTCKMMPTQSSYIDERYISNSPIVTNALKTTPFNQNDTVIIKSHLGTGKTVYIKEHLIRSGDYKRILIISPRKTYTHSQKGALNADGYDVFTSYLDTYYGDLAHIDRLIIQVESLHRIGNNFKKYDLVLLDEVESILNQLHSVKTNAGNLITNHEVLAMAVSTAKHVVMADAFISDRTFYFCNQLRNLDTTHYIENACNPYKRRAIMLEGCDKNKAVANIGGFVERICEALRAGRRIVVVWTSKRKGEQFVKSYLDTWEGDQKPTWLFYNSATTAELQEGLKNVDETWRSVQCLMMTTSITVGISYDPKIAEAEFDEIFLYGSACSSMPRDIAQALFRVRNLKSQQLTYVIDERGAFPSGSIGFNNITAEMKAKEYKLVRDHPVVKWTTCPNWARHNYVYCENEARLSRCEYRTILETYLVQSGYSLVKEKHIPLDKACLIVDKESKEAMLWENVEDISGDDDLEIQTLMKRGEAAADEILQHKKFVFRGLFVAGCDENDLCDWWNKFFVDSDEQCFWNVYNEKTKTVEDLKRLEATKRYAIMTKDCVRKRETMERFLKILDMKHSQETVVITPERLEEIGEKLKEVEKELRGGLGLRSSERKGEWKTKNTIDLIKVVLESWGCVGVETIMTQPRINGKQIKKYTIKVNKDNNIWDKIYNSNVKLDDYAFKF